MFAFSSSKNPQISSRIQASLAPGSRSLGAGIWCSTAHVVPCWFWIVSSSNSSISYLWHGKFETLGALEISCMLFTTADGIGWHALDLLLVPLLPPSLHTCGVPQRHSIY
ncbi:hypothetical protein QYF36_010040 [Acer negundo]|nr:hypothetical protein QYF36_010040 [Acer negundo]